MSITDALTGPTSPPRDNGELVFDAPWQMRAFGLTAELVDAGTFTWNQFREQLIAAIEAWDGDEWIYYERWTVALEACLTAAGALEAAEIDSLAHTYANRPHGHDH